MLKRYGLEMMRMLLKKKKKFGLSGHIAYRQAHLKRISRRRQQRLFVLWTKTKLSFLRIYKYVIFAVVLVVLGGGSMGLIFFSRYFNIQNVEIERDDLRVDVTVAQKILDRFLEKNLFLLNKEEVVDAVKVNCLEMEKVKVGKSFPHTLKVVLEEYMPVAKVRTETQGNLLLNERGVVVPQKLEAESHLPLIVINNYQNDPEYPRIAKYYLELLKELIGVEIGKEFIQPQKLQLILTLISEFAKEFNWETELIRYFPIEEEIHLKTTKGFEIWVSLSDNQIKQLQKLKRVLTEVNLNSLDLAYLDLRINEKVIYCQKGNQCVLNLQ